MTSRAAVTWTTIPRVRVPGGSTTRSDGTLFRRLFREQTVRKGLDCIHCFRRDVVSQGELAKSGHSAAFHLCADADDSDAGDQGRRVHAQGEDACKPGVQQREMKGLGFRVLV